MNLNYISSPDDYYNIQRLFNDVKKNVLGYYKSYDRTKRHSEQIRKLQLKFKKTLNIMSAEKTAFSVMQAKLCEKDLYLCFTKQRNMRYYTWLKNLENLDYSKRTRLLFSELRAKNRGMESFNAIRNSEGTLSESHSECLNYWASYCEKLYCGHGLKPTRFLPVENKELDYPISFVEFKLAVKSQKQ